MGRQVLCLRCVLGVTADTLNYEDMPLGAKEVQYGAEFLGFQRIGAMGMPMRLRRMRGVVHPSNTKGLSRSRRGRGPVR